MLENKPFFVYYLWILHVLRWSLSPVYTFLFHFNAQNDNCTLLIVDRERKWSSFSESEATFFCIHLVVSIYMILSDFCPFVIHPLNFQHRVYKATEYKWKKDRDRDRERKWNAVQFVYMATEQWFQMHSRFMYSVLPLWLC